jgi:hypothetical protein
MTNDRITHIDWLASWLASRFAELFRVLLLGRESDFINAAVGVALRPLLLAAVAVFLIFELPFLVRSATCKHKRVHRITNSKLHNRSDSDEEAAS